MKASNIQEITVENGYMKVALDASVRRGEGISFFSRLNATAHEEGLRHIMVDARGLGCTNSPGTQFQFANTHMRKINFDRRLKLGVWIEKVDPEYEFFELTFSNAGYQFKVFTEEKDLLNWFG